MQIWLPPSEGKAAATAGPRLELDSLVFPELAGARSAVIAALEELGAGEDAARVLKLGAKSAAEADANLRLFEDGCAPALDLYTGVLFEALDAGSLTDAQARKLNGVTLIASGPVWVCSSRGLYSGSPAGNGGEPTAVGAAGDVVASSA